MTMIDRYEKTTNFLNLQELSPAGSTKNTHSTRRQPSRCCWSLHTGESHSNLFNSFDVDRSRLAVAFCMTPILKENVVPKMLSFNYYQLFKQFNVLSKFSFFEDRDCLHVRDRLWSKQMSWINLRSSGVQLLHGVREFVAHNAAFFKNSCVSWDTL